MATTMSTVTASPAHPSSTIVNVSEDADLRLIRVLASTTTDPSAFESTCSSLISSGDAAGLLRAVISQPGAITGLLDESYSVDECASAFSLLAALLDRVRNAELEKELGGALVDSVCSAVDGGKRKSEKRSAMVAALFNLRSDGGEKTRLLAKIVELADTASLTPGMPKGVSALADMLESNALQATLALWGSVPDIERRALYKAVVKAMDSVLVQLAEEGKGEKGAASVEVEAERKIKATKERKQTYLSLILETYSESQVETEALSYAQEASIGAIRDPISLFSYQQNLLHLPAVLALQKKSPQTAALYDLLKIFHEGKLQDYRDFTSMPDKSSVFTTFDLDEEECMRNMCLLSLISLAGEHEEIPYTAIASTLEIKEDQVEKWVILGVSSGLMEAKMDQLRKVVLVQRCAVRKFGPNEWAALKIRLDKWKSNVRGVLDALKNSGDSAAMDGQ
mmetsp:Transcript_13351/g.28222  ORF Transcript_13351/g.28222 Transcript_13351/m.28222 type:complete len:453 (-) Transcript_13351:94-1452(-)